MAQDNTISILKERLFGKRVVGKMPKDFSFQYQDNLDDYIAAGIDATGDKLIPSGVSVPVLKDEFGYYVIFINKKTGHTLRVSVPKPNAKK